MIFMLFVNQIRSSNLFKKFVLQYFLSILLHTLYFSKQVKTVAVIYYEFFTNLLVQFIIL